MRKIRDGHNAFFDGSVKSSEIERIQKDADILIHVEGLSLKSELQAHQSFSTKIVDYLKNARAVFVVGARNTASVDYFLKNDIGIVATDKKSVYDCLCKYINNPDIIREYSKKAYFYGKGNHSQDRIKNMVYNDIFDMVENKKSAL